jgi:Domain of unknown function (DUF5753)
VLTERQREIGELEKEATSICVFQPTMVPGLLQIADYARRVMSHGNPSDQADIDAAVQKRLERQTILYDQTKFTPSCSAFQRPTIRADVSNPWHGH